MLALILAAMLATDAPAERVNPVAMPTCDGPADCETKWGRALRWVMARNSTIEVQTDNLIRTGAADPVGVNYFQVTRISDGSGRFTIDLRIGCGNPFIGCKPKAMAADFASAVMSTTP